MSVLGRNKTILRIFIREAPVFLALIQATHLNGFLYHVVDNEETEDEFTGHDEIVLDVNISDQFHSP